MRIHIQRIFTVALVLLYCACGSKKKNNDADNTDDSGTTGVPQSESITIDPSATITVITSSGVLDGLEVDTTDVTSTDPFDFDVEIVKDENGIVVMTITVGDFDGNLDLTLPSAILTLFDSSPSDFTDVTATIENLNGENVTVLPLTSLAADNIRPIISISESSIVRFTDNSGEEGGGEGGGGTALTNASSILFNRTQTEHCIINDANAADLRYTMTSEFSISLWAKFTTGSNNQVFLAKANTTQGWRFGVTNGDKLRFYWNNMAANLQVSSTNTINMTGWHHYVVTKASGTTGSTVKLYIDGTGLDMIVDSQSLGSYIDIGQYVTIGILDSDTPTDPLDGFMDELYIYSDVLSPTEVTELYNAGVPVDPATAASASSLIHSYGMGDESGDSATGAPWIQDRIGDHDFTSCVNTPALSADVP